MKKIVYLILMILITISINSCLKQDDDLAAKLNNQSVVEYDNENNEKAVKLVSQAIKLKNDSYQIYLNRAKYYKRLKQYEPMIPDLNEAIRLLKSKNNFLIKPYIEMLDYRHFAYTNLKMYENAFDDIDALIKIDSLNAEYYFKRAQIYNYQGSDSLSIKDLSNAIFLNPNFVDAYSRRGMSYSYIKQYEKSLNDFNMYFSKCGIVSDTYFSLIVNGATLIELKKYQEARNSISIFLDYEADNEEAFLLLAVIYFKLDDLVIAKKFYDKANLLKKQKDINWEIYSPSIYYSTIIKSTLKELEKL